MNIIKKELRANFKPFVFWTIGLAFLLFAGMMKFKGIESAGSMDINALFEQFPRVVLAVFGMVDVDVTTVGGYYAVLAFYLVICGCLYGINLGGNVIAGEFVDKTYEFICTKPRKRSFILFTKMITASIYLFAFCLLNYIFSVLAVKSVKIEENIHTEILLYSIAVFLISFLFFAMSMCMAAILKKPEKGITCGNIVFLVSFILSIVYDMFEEASIVRVFTPIKYFLPSQLIDNVFAVPYAIVSIVLIVVFLVVAFCGYNKRDLLC